MCEVIELDESIDPQEFVSSINQEIGAEIEYIQPDYVMELSNETNVIMFELDGEEELEEETLDDTSAEKVVTDNAAESETELKTEDNSVSVSEETTTKVSAIDRLYDIDTDLAGAWEVSRGNGVTVAVIDTGVDINHPALRDRVVSGYDFFNDTDNVYNPDLGMEQAHGTHIAGIIAKVAPEANIMPLKVFENGRAYTSDIINAIEYAEANGATIVNCSFGSTDNNQALKEAMDKSVLFFVCAAGNNRTNIDETPIYPASFNFNNTISVAALNQDLGMTYFSNYGIKNVDISAWGRDVYSTFPNGEYGTMNGTSMSAAYVTGAAALATANGGIELKQTLKSTSDKLSCLDRKVDNGNKINFTAAVTGATNNEVITVTPDDDFDVLGYQPTPQENWELFVSKPNVQVAAGYLYTMVLKADGTIWTWGNNEHGQLGDGTTSNRTTPKVVVGISGIIAIAAESNHSLALKEDGTVWTWGSNLFGQLGNGSTTNSSIPVKVNNLTGVSTVAGGEGHSVALKSDGTVWAWGWNTRGQLGNGTYNSSYIPVKVVGKGGVGFLTEITSISANYGNCNLALKSDGTVWSWGDNYWGELGDGTKTTRSTPAQVSNLTNARAIMAADVHCIALKSDGTVWAWGQNNYGQLGDGTTINRTVPVQIKDIGGEGYLIGVTTIASGSYHTLALKGNGSLWAWGFNEYGQLGDGTHTDNSTPVQVKNSDGVGWLADITSIETGYHHCLALKKDGTVWSWGWNYYNQLGDGTAIDASIPVQVKGSGGTGYLTDITKITAGFYHNLAISSNGTAWAWGHNNRNQLGDGTTVGKSTPVRINDLSNIAETSAGIYFSLALDSAGTVWAWGWNEFGQFGIGSLGEKSNVPVQAFIIEISEEDDGTNPSISKTIQIQDNQEYIILLTAKNSSKINDKTFKINYQAANLELQNIVSGDIEIISTVNGALEIKKKTILPDGKQYSGIIAAVKFKAKQTGQASISVVQ